MDRLRGSSMRVLSAAKGEEVVALGFAPGRAAVVAAYSGGGIFLWDLASADPPRGYRENLYRSDSERTLTFTPDGLALLEEGTENSIPNRIDLETGKETPLG